MYLGYAQCVLRSPGLLLFEAECNCECSSSFCTLDAGLVAKVDGLQKPPQVFDAICSALDKNKKAAAA